MWNMEVFSNQDETVLFLADKNKIKTTNKQKQPKQLVLGL